MKAIEKLAIKALNDWVTNNKKWVKILSKGARKFKKRYPDTECVICGNGLALAFDANNAPINTKPTRSVERVGTGPGNFEITNEDDFFLVDLSLLQCSPLTCNIGLQKITYLEFTESTLVIDFEFYNSKLNFRVSKWKRI